MSDLESQELNRKKRFLKRYRKNRVLILRLKNKVETLDGRIAGMRSPVLSDMPRGGTPVTKDDLIAEKIEIEERIKRLESKGKILKKEILEKIDELDDIRYVEILEAFFIECLSFEDIADNEGYGLRHVMRLYTEALNEIAL
mgnify:CR=1 FL=1